MNPVQLDLLDWMAVQPVGATSERIDTVLLHRIDPARNMARFYVLDLSRDLFGEWCVVRRWGRIGARRGQMRLDAHPSAESAQQALTRLRTAKQRRGYH